MASPTHEENAINCPPRDDWMAFRRNHLSRAQMEHFESHAEQCERCMEVLEACEEESDTLVHVLATLPENADDEPAFRMMKANLLANPEPIGTQERPTETFALDESPSLIALPARLGSYELLELLGRGATGAVYRARHLKLDRIVAVKVLHTNYSNRAPDTLARFQQETRAVGRLDHPHIVRATDAGEEHGRHYLVMEYVEGIDLSRLLRQAGPLRIADACELTRQAASALAFAHQHGIVHRDVKPSNLLFTEGAQVKLLDLGLAMAETDRESSERDDALGVARGTADYMAPEQWTHFERVDGRADIYSLGCTLYRLLTGRVVYPTASQDALSKMDAHCRAPVPRIRDDRPEVTLGLQKILLRMLAKQRDDRFASAEELIEHLTPYTADAHLSRLTRYIEGAKSAPAALGDLEATTPMPKRRWTRRKTLMTAAAALPIALGVWPFVRRAIPQLESNRWRSLPLTVSPQSFRWEPSSTTPKEREATITADPEIANQWTIRAGTDTLFIIGQPVVGQFSIRFHFRMQEPNEAFGIFFRYRPHKGRERRTYPFQAIEICSLPNEQKSKSKIRWSEYCYYEKPDGLYDRDYDPLAETTVDQLAGNGFNEMVVRVGETGIPVVHWNGSAIGSSQWDLSWKGRHRSQWTRVQLQHAYLGQLGLFARQSAVLCTTPQLAYHVRGGSHV